MAITVLLVILAAAAAAAAAALIARRGRRKHGTFTVNIPESGHGTPAGTLYIGCDGGGTDIDVVSGGNFIAEVKGGARKARRHDKA